MRKYFVIFLAGACVATAQLSRINDWWTYGGDAQRSGWMKTDARLTKDNAKDLQLLWTMKLESQPKGQRSLTPPVIIGTLISYRGFKELAFVGGSYDNLYAINADLGKMFFQRQLVYSSEIPQAIDAPLPCGGGLTALATLTPPFVLRTAPAATGGDAAAPSRGAPVPARGAATPARGATAPARKGAATGRGPAAPATGAARLVYVLSTDGRLHRMSAANGDEAVLPIKFLPPNAKASSLNMADNVVYTTTNQGCGAAPNAVWALDLKGEEPKISSFPSNGGGFWGLGGVVLGSDNAVYAQASDRLFVLTPGEVKRKTHFLLSGPSIDQNAGMNAASPVVFKYKDHEMVAATGKDGHIYLLDAGSLGILSRTSQVADTNSPERGVWGALTSWEDPNGVRWILAPVWGPVGADFKALSGNGAVANGAVVAFKVQELEGKPVLAPAWVSRDMSSPEPPIVVNGVVFALAAGDYTRQVTETWGVHRVEERPKGSTHATLYALDAATGKELYSSGSSVTAPAALTGLTVANSRAYFGTVDSTFYTFGLYMEH